MNLSNHGRVSTDSDLMIDEDEDGYSQNFDDSVGQSKNTIKDRINTRPIDVIVEGENEEDHVSSSKYEEEELEINGTASVFSNSKPGDLEGGQSSDDQEILKSSSSIQWQLNFKRGDSPAPADISSSFEKQQSISDPDDLEALADKITEEFLEILLNDIRDSPELALGAPHNEADFKEKFPFNLEKDSSDDEPIHKVPVVIIKPVESPKVERKTTDDFAREKYEADFKKLQDTLSANVNYLTMIIENINKNDLIAQLETPIDNDPLKKLAYIFSQENDDSQVQNETNNGSTLLSLEYFIEMEEEYQRKYNYEKLLDEEQKDNALSDRNEQTHHKALFDAFNLALDMERPYKEKGKPAPWSKLTRVVKKDFTEVQLDQII